MPDWGLSIVWALVVAVVALAAVIGFLVKQKKAGNPGDCLERDEFTDQVVRCNDRFIEAAKTNGVVKATLKNIDRRLQNIEGWLKN